MTRSESPEPGQLSRQLDPRALLLKLRTPLFHLGFDAMRVILRFASRLQVTFFLKVMAHPQWLFEGNQRLTDRPVTFTAPPEPSADDLELCGRIIRAYRAAHDADGSLSPIWTEKIDRYYAGLAKALETEDPQQLDEELRWMFRRPFLAGISTPLEFEDPAAGRYWSMATYDTFVSLAEAVGAIHAECPEQGATAAALTEGIDSLPPRIEASLGISLDYPRVGAPYGIMIGDRLITRETGRHLHAALRLREAIELHLGEQPEQGVEALEIGGGFGGAAMWYLRLLDNGRGTYTIVDLPLMNAFQAYFLGKIYGPEALALFGEELSPRRVRILPPQGLTADASVTADVVFNQDSMPEMSESAALGYLNWMSEQGCGLFVSCNQEAATPVDAMAQNVVADLVQRHGGMRRIARQPSWLRRGYVEEIFRIDR